MRALVYQHVRNLFGDDDDSNDDASTIIIIIIADIEICVRAIVRPAAVCYAPITLEIGFCVMPKRTTCIPTSGTFCRRDEHGCTQVPSAAAA